MESNLEQDQKLYRVSKSSLHWSFDCFYVVLVPLELIPSKPPHGTYVIVLFCTLQKGSNNFVL